MDVTSCGDYGLWRQLLAAMWDIVVKRLDAAAEVEFAFQTEDELDCVETFAIQVVAERRLSITRPDGIDPPQGLETVARVDTRLPCLFTSAVGESCTQWHNAFQFTAHKPVSISRSRCKHRHWVCIVPCSFDQACMLLARHRDAYLADVGTHACVVFASNLECEKLAKTPVLGRSPNLRAVVASTVLALRRESRR